MTTRLVDLFHEVTTLVRDTPVTSELEVSNDDKLRMYGLYKQVTMGVCTDTAPSMFQPVQRAKYESWVSYKHLTNEEAMIKYVRVASTQDHWLGRKCRDLLEKYEKQIALDAANDANVATNVDDAKTEDSLTPKDDMEMTAPLEESTEKKSALTSPVCTKAVVAPPRRKPQLLERWFGMKPLIPRGKIDISYRQLGMAASFCLESYTSPTWNARHDEIAQLWKGREEEEKASSTILVGLSVRSLLDLYLRAKNFPVGSEVIVVPPINIPTMVTIMEHHQLTIVPVDLAESFEQDQVLRIDIDHIKQAITLKTVAIMVVHPFGIETATDDDMQQLRAVADEHSLDIIEDCAECYTGRDSTKRPHADLALFSFGTIKTATALGGGIAVGKDLMKMQRLHQSLYEPQRQSEFLSKVIKALVVHLISDFPIVYGLLLLICQWLRLDFDRTVSSSIRSFLSRNNDLISLIRHRPSLALLSTIAMRLQQSNETEKVQNQKVQRCEKMTLLLHQKQEQQHHGSSATLRWPKAVETHRWWLAPIVVSDPEATSKRLLEYGFDVPRGLSQLQAVGTCPRAQEFMKSILYLPVASRSLSDSDMQLLSHALSAPPKGTTSVAKKSSSRRYNMTPLKLAIISVLLLGGLWSVPGSLSIMLKVFYWAVVLLLCKFGMEAMLTRVMGDLYLQSAYFAKYNPILRHVHEQDQERDHETPVLNGMNVLRLVPLSMTDSSQKSSIILTGATGFLGCSILRELLCNPEVMATIDKIVLICRSKRGKSALDRCNSLLDQKIFSFLSREERENVILVVEGDTSKPNAGIVAQDMALLRNELRVHSVINCAASVGFTQSLDQAAVANIRSALNLQQLSQRLRARFVHISTAFVHGGSTGTSSSPLRESLFSLEKFDANRIYRSMLGNQMYATLAMSTLDFPNTYTFSKSVCEHLLLERSCNDTIIIRPSIIGPSIQAPFEGWAGQKPSTIVAAACLYIKFPYSIWSFGKHEVAVIPVDVVARFVLAKTLSANQPITARLRSDDVSDVSSASSSNDFETVQPIQDVESLNSESCSAEPTVRSQGEADANSVIFTAAWNADSPESSTFSWYDLCLSVPQIGGVLGYLTRFTGYIGLMVSLKVLPSLGLKPKKFALLYYIVIQLPYIMFLRALELCQFTKLHQTLSKLLGFIDLPVLFYPFMNNTFVFESELKAPEDMDGDRYGFVCVAAAFRFLDELSSRQPEGVKNFAIRNTSCVLVGGKNHRLLTSDLSWALTQPSGSLLVRLVGYLFIKVLRASSNAVSVDMESFSETCKLLSSAEGRKMHVVLAPTHRSFYDFILISFIAFSLPELKIQIPYIAAAHEFSSLPFLGWLIEYARAFFVKRGRGMDPNLSKLLLDLKGGSKNEGKCIEVFIEGTRSRDRRFQKPKTGLLRSLDETGGVHLIVPICISYERIPEQQSLSNEGSPGRKRGLRTNGLFSWLWDTMNGKLPIGRIHIAAAKPIALMNELKTEFDRTVMDIQDRQQSQLRISSYHINAAGSVLGLDVEIISEALTELGCNSWPQDLNGKDMMLPPPSSQSEAWSIMMQFGHVVAPRLDIAYAHWAKWLCPFEMSGTRQDIKVESVTKLIRAFEALFDRVEEVINRAIESVEGLRICQLTASHVVQVVMREKQDFPVGLLLECASLKIGSDGPPLNSSPQFSRIADIDVENEYEELGSWGFKDSKFQVRPDKKGKPTVTMSGSRYGVSGKPLKRLIPFIEAQTRINIDLYKDPALEVTGLDIDDCELSTEDIESIENLFSRNSRSIATRIRHGTGHSQEEAYQLRRAGKARVPDIVVWPTTDSQIEQLIKIAGERKWNLIPHGGGTNVSQATKCPEREIDPRPIVSVDMTDMKRILWVNEEDGIAHVQAGITGIELIEEMKRRGYTIGHEPDSLEFSTLGGWIATKASGMKRSKYGNIEDIVVDIRVAGSTGTFWKGDGKASTAAAGRESRGPDLLQFFLGSEGCLGIITSAVVRIWPLPAVLCYESVLLRDFSTGVEFSRNISKLGPFLPASVRLLDNAHFRLGQALREESSLLEHATKQICTLLLPSLRSMSSDKVVCCTIQFEGNEDEVQEQRKHIKRLALQHGGVLLGSRIGRSGYELTFVIAYLRDFALSYNFLGDSFETFAPWSKLEQIVAATKQKVNDEHKSRHLPGEVFVGCRVTQLYHDGACLYFYVCMYCGNVDNASRVFADIEHAARLEILKEGGSLSHHHGVGKIRASYLQSMDSQALRDGLVAVKNGLDPCNTFGAGNGLFGS